MRAGHRPLCGGGALFLPTCGRAAVAGSSFPASPSLALATKLPVVAGRPAVDPRGRGGGRRLARVLSGAPSGMRARAHASGRRSPWPWWWRSAGARGARPAWGASPGRSSPETRLHAFRADDPGWPSTRACWPRFSPLLQAVRSRHGGVASWNFWRQARAGRRSRLWSCSCWCRSSSFGRRRTRRRPVSPRPSCPCSCPPARAGPGGRWLAASVAAGAGRFLFVWASAGQLALLVPYLPDGLTFYSPLLGRAAAARVFTIGQGEGLEEAASYVDAEPGAASRSWPCRASHRRSRLTSVAARSTSP